MPEVRPAPGWVLEQASGLEGTTADEAAAWRAHAASLVDGYDAATGLYEQFRGYAELEPLVIAELARERPVRGDELVGVERAQRAQVLKQADVLMLHHMLPAVARPGSLEPNLDHYLPRSAHGSSLSPGVHAALLFRAGRLEKAVELLRLTTRFDLGDLNGGPTGGVHLACLASIWHALVLGAAGVSPAGRTLAIDPHVPSAWGELSLALRYRDSRVRLRLSAGAVEASFDPPGTLAVRGGEPVQVGPEPRRLALAGRAPDAAARS